MAITKQAAARQFVRFTKIDKVQRKVWGVVYAPMTIDAHGDLMTAEEIERAAHGFLPSADLATAIDENHNHIPTWSKIIESYIVKTEGDLADIGAWIVGMHIVKDGTWTKVERGELTGFSFEGTGMKRKAKVSTIRQKYQLGRTEPAADGHSHLVFVEYDKNGRIARGWTSESNNHKHEVLYHTVSELSANHKHRIIL